MKSTFINELQDSSHTIVESFKSLRTNFLFCGTEYKSIVITSCVKHEGKSTISIELARSLALADKKVLLIDADLRKSVYATRYTTNETEVIGLSEYLSSQASLEDVLYSTQEKNLNIVFAGAVPPNPVELLNSTKFKDMVNDFKTQYDFVIIDAAPLGAVIDAAVIGSFADAAIMVIAANEIHCRHAQDVKEQLEKSGCKILGAILNKVPLKSGSYYSGYYRKYYGRKYGTYGYGQLGGYGYGDDDNTKKKKKK